MPRKSAWTVATLASAFGFGILGYLVLLSLGPPVTRTRFWVAAIFLGCLTLATLIGGLSRSGGRRVFLLTFGASGAAVIALLTAFSIGAFFALVGILAAGALVEEMERAEPRQRLFAIPAMALVAAVVIWGFIASERPLIECTKDDVALNDRGSGVGEPITRYPDGSIRGTVSDGRTTFRFECKDGVLVELTPKAS